MRRGTREGEGIGEREMGKAVVIGKGKEKGRKGKDYEMATN